MTAYNPKNVEKMYLNKLEMTKVPKNDPHSWFSLQIDGLPTILTKLATNHKEDIGDELIKMMARQLKIAPKIYRGLVDCSVSKEKYLELVKSGDTH